MPKNPAQQIWTHYVDSLELKASVPKDKIVFTHGKITLAACPTCIKEYDINILRDKYVMKDKIMYYSICNTPFKAKVIFYGECIPLNFYLQFVFISGCDLAFIMGASLKVSPFNQLPDK